MTWMKKIFKQREFMIFMIVAAMFIFMTFASPYFFTVPNLLRGIPRSVPGSHHRRGHGESNGEWGI